MPEDVLINFVGNADELKPVENVLESIVEKGDDVGEAWKKTAAAMAAGNKTSVDSTNKLAKSVDALAVAAKTADKAVIGGAYKEYLKQIQAQLGLTNKELLSYVQNARRAAQQEIFNADTDEEVAELTASIEVMNEQLKEMGVNSDETAEKTKSLRARIREAKEELVAMAEAGLAGTPAFKELQEKAGELDDQMRDLNQIVKGFGSDTKNIDGVISAVSGLAGGFAVVQGAAALFGEGEEEVQKALLKVNAAMSILQGLQQIQTVMQKESAASILLTSLFYKQNTAATAENVAAKVQLAVAEATATATAAGLTEAEIAQAAATAAATAETEALNVAMMLNPAAIVVTAVIALVAALAFFASNNREAEETQRNLNDALQRATIYLDDNLKSLEQQTAKQLALAKQRGASITELASMEGKASLVRLKAIDDARVAAAVQYNEAKNNDKESLEAKQKLYEKIYELEKQYHDESKALEVKSVEFRTLLNEQELKSFTAFQQAKIAATISGSDTERSVTIGTIRAIAVEREKSAEFIALTEGEKAQKRAEDDRQIRDLELANYQHYLKGKTALDESYVANAKLGLLKNEVDTIDSINRVTNAEINAAKKRRDEALKSDPNLNSGETKKIVAQANLEIAELEKQKQDKLLAIRKAGLNAELVLAQKGTRQEYDAKIAALENQREIDLSATELTQQQINEIIAKYQVERNKIYRDFTEAQLQNSISYSTAELDKFGLIESEKLVIVLKRLDTQRALEISQADENAAKIVEINAKYDKQIIESKKATAAAILADNIRTLEVFNAISLAAAQRLYSKDSSSFQVRKTASEQILQDQLTSLRVEEAALKKSLYDRLITQHEYDVSVQEINNKRSEAVIANEERITAATVRELEKRTARIKAVFSLFQNGLSATIDTSAITTAISEFQNLGVMVNDTIQKIKEGTISAEDGIAAIAAASVASVQNVINQAFADSSSARRQQVADDLAALEEQKNAEIGVKNLTEQQKSDIDKKYREKEKQIKIKAFIADQQAKKEQAIINGALAVAQAFATTPYPFSLIVAGIVTAAVLAEVSKINNAKPPKYRHGEIDIQGPGTTTSDSIHARISKGESVIKAESTAKWKDALIAINNDQFENYLIKQLGNFVFPDMPDHQGPEKSAPIDYDRLGDSIAKKIAGELPEPTYIQNTMDENGMHTFIKRGSSRTEYKNHRYSMS